MEHKLAAVVGAQAQDAPAPDDLIILASSQAPSAANNARQPRARAPPVVHVLDHTLVSRNDNRQDDDFFEAMPECRVKQLISPRIDKQVGEEGSESEEGKEILRAG